MNSLAITDSLLFFVTLLIAVGPKYPPSIRLAAGLFAAAACLGVLRFTGVLSLPTMHAFFSGLGATAAYPLLAATFLFSGSVLANRWRFSSIFAVIAGALGLVASALEFGIWGNAVALISVAALVLRSIITRDALATVGGVSLLAAVVLFALNVSFASLLKPGDFLHLFMALGLALLGFSARVKAAHKV
ncbi:MAG: hypothetical protein O3B02_11250 [Proteobacteria bacterium]|nr:hypothetical protein [Pseudomonadota bacterium]MDA0896662.1 hypothetical protein [Pseudomonadota bacterium]MDA1245555.1 hypothetical protein [Pseudomonadota bacterium]